jgi:hypothetical protein
VAPGENPGPLFRNILRDHELGGGSPFLRLDKILVANISIDSKAWLIVGIYYHTVKQLVTGCQVLPAASFYEDWKMHQNDFVAAPENQYLSRYFSCRQGCA